MQPVSTKDIGWFAANAFLHSSENRNAALTLVGDELTQEEADVIFKEVVGLNMQMALCIIGSAVKWFKSDTVGDMFHWFEVVGYGGNVEECHKAHPGMQDYRTWLKQSSPFVKSSGTE